MAFVNQVQTTQFAPQIVKSLNVLCQKCVQEVGDTIIPLPAGTILDTIVIDIEPTDDPPEIRTTEVLPGKVVNMGVVPASLVITVAGVEIVNLPLLEVPFQAEVECPGIQPGEAINVQKHDVQLEGLITQPFQQILDIAGVLTLSPAVIVKAVVQACVVISREEIMKINAASQFCPCP